MENELKLIQSQIQGLAFEGRWTKLLPLLQRHPDLINFASPSKGYTALHQAAWHGATLSVVGELLHLGADPALLTLNKFQSPHQLAMEKHPERVDLQYILVDEPRTLGQIMRKILADNADLFEDYSGNRIIFDRLLECFGYDLCTPNAPDIEQRLDGALKAITGLSLNEGREMSFKLGKLCTFKSDPCFWQGRFLNLLKDYALRYRTKPIEREWAVVADLFYPADEGWGLRGDMFLWLEMGQALLHVPIPDESTELKRILTSAFSAITCRDIGDQSDFYVKRFARGGMSSGGIATSVWRDTLIPLLVKRAGWLQQSWARG